MYRNRVFAYALQETWRSGTQETYPWLCNHTARITLSNQTQTGTSLGWHGNCSESRGTSRMKKAGSLCWEFGERIVAVQLGVQDEKGKDISIFFVSVYAPVSNVKQSVQDKYHQELEHCVAAAGKEDILLIATDANVSMGVCTGERDSVLGSFGIQHWNQSGFELNYFCTVNGLVAATTFFQKNQHGTWVNPRSQKHHQLGSFLIDKSSFAGVRDAGCY